MVDVSAHLDPAPSIRILTRLHYPEGLSELGKLVQDCRLVRVCRVVIQLLELEELWVVETFFDVESQRQIVMVLLANCLVVHLHIIIDGLLVAQVVIVLHLAIQQQVVRRVILLLLLVLVVCLLASATEDPAVLCGTAVSSC